MKLSEINYDLTSAKEIEILDPVTKKSFENPAFISIYSIESNIGKQCQVSIYRDMLEITKEKKKPTDADIKKLTCKNIASLVAGWRGIEDEKGKEIEYSKEKAIEVLENYDMIFNVVDKESAKLGNYLGK